jgi:D-alanyl-D-alanine dipeptidase
MCGGKHILFYIILLATTVKDMRCKITDRFPICPFVVLFFSTLSGLSGFTQDSVLVKPPPVIHDWKAYRSQVKLDSTKKMIELRSRIPRLVYDLRYAGINNFMHRRMYPAGTSTTFLRLPAVTALLNVQKELNEKGMGLKIFDAYRPYSVTVKFWELVKDERYVANPAKGSGHNRGDCR